MKSKRFLDGPLILLLVATLLHTHAAAAAKTSLPMGEETFGNKPLNAANYKNWPKIMPVANNTHRVYHTWVNGDERFYYQGSAEELNDLLEGFSKLKSKKKEVLLLPQREAVRSFDQSQSFEFNCSMHLVGGIAQHVAGKPKGAVFWPVEPQLTIYVTPELDLAKLKIPQECQLVSLPELIERYREGLTSKDKTIRGWGTGFLVGVDPYSMRSLELIAQLCVDSDDWVGLNALGQISKFGHKAKDQLSMLKRVANSDVQQNAKRAREAIKAIEEASEPEAVKSYNQLETRFRKQQRQAQQFIDDRRPT